MHLDRVKQGESVFFCKEANVKRFLQNPIA